MMLPDGRTLFVEVPRRMARVDRGGEVGFTPEGVRFLDRLRALATPLGSAPSPAYLAALRDALGLTQEELGARIGKSPLTISRWERGTMRPGRDSLAALGKVLAKAKRDGVVLPG
jgi:DNA-binding XRE family transcriptional regulator